MGAGHSKGTINRSSTRFGGASKRGSSKKREADRSASPFSDGSSNSGASNIPRPMRPHLGAIPRQPTHPPQRERARDKTANSNALTTASSTSSSSAAVLKRNQRTSHLTSSATPSPKRVNTGHRRAQTVEKGTTTEMKAPSARKTGTRHLPSGAQVQKPAQLRDNNRLGGGVVSKNGGPANNHGSSTRGNAVVLLQRQHIQLATVEAPTPEAMVETAKSPTPKGPPPVPPKLLEELKQSATRIEALLVLIQYLVVDLDAFSTPSLKKAVEEYKTEAINTKLNLDEAVASCQRLAEEEKISEVRHKENIDELIRKNGENLAELEARLTSQVEETQCRYEEELKRRDRLNNRNMEALLEDLKLYAERAEKAEKEVESEEKQVENLKKEKEEILARENDLKQLSSRLQSEITDLVEKLRKENVIKAGDCGKHRDEIQSLQAVLDLRTKELHDHRKKTEEYRQKSEALNSALARNAALQARVEDLEAQLQRKVSTERKLQERVRHLSENVERECRQNEQLALENEVLEWKINESSKLMSSFSGQSDMSSSMTGSMMASSSPSSDRRSISTMAISLGSPDSPPNFMFSRFSPRLSPKSPFSDVSGTIELEEEEEEEEEDDMEGDEEEDEEEEIKVGAGGLEEEEEEEDDKLSIEPTPITPKVRTLVEKNESISWLVEMEEVIPASSLSSHIQSAGMRRAHGSPQSTPLNLLPQMIPELPPVANSPSTSPTSSDPSSNIFRGKGGSPPHSARRVAMPPAKKTRPERGKLAGHGMMYASTPLKTSMTHGHHHRHHGRYHHQPRSTSRLPPSDSPLCSARSRSVSTDSESLDAEEASAAANARLAELKAWRGGKSAGERVPSAPGPQDTVPTAGGDSEEGGKKDGPGEKGDWDMNGRECGDGFDSKFPVDDGSRLSEDGFRVGGSSPRSKPPTPMEDKNSPSKYGSPFCEFGEDFSDQSPFHGKFEVNGTSLNPMEDSSSSVEIILEIPPKKQVSSPPPPQQSSTSGAVPTPFHPPAKQGVAMAEASHHMHHHQHYQSRHVLSSLCAHPHLSIKESAGEAMISEEISDDTQGESDEEERGEGKLLEDSEEEEVELAEVSGGSTPHRCGDATTPSAEQRAVGAQGARCENGEEPKCNGAQEEPAAGNTLKLGQQVLSSSTPDSSHFAHTDSSVMELSWSEDLDLMPSESEV